MGGIMAKKDPTYYCDTVQSELAGLKARAYDIVRQLEKRPDKEKIRPEFQEINSLVDDLNTTIGRLRSECPTDFSSQKSEIEKKKVHLLAKMNKWDEDHIPGGYVGG
jgi:hypothetical protein